eukprot:scaffold11483_cov162-Amphora_coffeaeformis.AAC.1
MILVIYIAHRAHVHSMRFGYILSVGQSVEPWDKAWNRRYRGTVEQSVELQRAWNRRERGTAESVEP